MRRPANGPTQTDRGHPNRSDFDRARKKVLPAAQRIFAGLSAGTQTRPKFEHSLHRRGLTAQSVHARPLSPRGLPASDRGRFVSCAPC
jgi:hypothetical protein